MSVQAAVAVDLPVVVAVDVGKKTVALSVTDAGRHRLLGPVDFEMTGPGLEGVLTLIRSRLAGGGLFSESRDRGCRHYHRPLLAPCVWPAGWEVLELNPADVAEQRRVQGRRRIKTDALDLEAITELVLAGRGIAVADREAVIGELGAWAAHRTRRVQVRTATKNQLLGQLDRAFPGPTLVLPDVLGTKVGRQAPRQFRESSRCATPKTTSQPRPTVRRWNRRRAGPDAVTAMADAHALRRT